jgi:hypothetical protein
MLKRFIPAITILAILSFISVQEARADGFSSQQPNELALRVGAFFPTAGSAQNFGGSTQFIGGLNYALSTTHGRYPSASSVYLDYQSGSQHSGYLHSGGLGLQYQTAGQGYLGGALGIYNTAVRTPDGTLSGNSTGGGGRVFVGYNMTQHADLQLDYHFAPSALGVSPNGLGLEFGYRL